MATKKSQFQVGIFFYFCYTLQTAIYHNYMQIVLKIQRAKIQFLSKSQRNRIKSMGDASCRFNVQRYNFFLE